MLGVAVPLTVADLVSKEIMRTEPWAYHQRSLAWGLLCLVVLVGLLAICRVPALLVPPTAGFLAAGVLGNGLSAVTNDFWVPNPLVAETESTMVAFNLADVWAVLGIGSLTLVLAVWLIRNRALLPGHGSRRAGDEPEAIAEDGNTVF
jgi:hypothetical protein